MYSKFATRFKLGDDHAVEAFRSFVETKLFKSQTEYNYFEEVKAHRAFWIVSRLGRIVDNKLEMLGILFSDEGGLATANEEYYPVGEIAQWKPEYCSGDYVYQLQLAHGRKIRQVEFFLGQSSVQFSLNNY